MRAKPLLDGPLAAVAFDLLMDPLWVRSRCFWLESREPGFELEEPPRQRGLFDLTGHRGSQRSDWLSLRTTTLAAVPGARS